VTMVTTEDRLTDAQFDRMRDQLATVGVRVVDTPEARERLRAIRKSYEPDLFGLSRMLMMPLPPWWNERSPKDNWQSSPRGLAEAHL